MDLPGLSHRTVRLQRLCLHLVEAGSGPLVILLHGFPEFWYAWRRQIPALLGAGYRVVAPDLRGYNLSDRPSGVAAYRLSTLMEDVVDLVHVLGERRAVLVGHDWGGVIAWHAGMHHPEVVRALVILNAPHPATFRRELLRSPSQILRSWYAGAFQIPLLPEALLRAREHALLRAVLRAGPARTHDDLRRYLEALSPPGALTAAINYYRAALRHPPPEVRSIAAPTLVIWGDSDPFLVPGLADGLERWVDDLEVERLPGADHWLHQENAGEVNRHILRFLERRLPR